MVVQRQLLVGSGLDVFIADCVQACLAGTSGVYHREEIVICVHGFFCVSVIWTRPDWLLLQNARRRVTSADLAILSRAFLVISIGRKVGSSTGEIEQTFSFRPRVKRAKDAQSARCHGRCFDGASCTDVLMDVIICNAVATLCLLYAVSRGKCVVAAIFLRNGDRHLDGVAILVLLVRCSGTQWYAVVRVFLEYMDIVALKFAKAPGPARSRGGWQWRSLRPLALPSFDAVHQTLSLGPCTVTVNGAAGHNRWGVVERRLPAKTQGRTVDCSFTL